MLSTIRRAATATLPALLLLPAAAQAAPAPIQLGLPLELGVVTGESLGVTSFRTTFTDAAATSTASAPAITLAKGSVYRIHTCIQTHINWGRHATNCRSKDVDTRNNLLPAIVTGPSVTVTEKRPPAGQWGYAYHQVAVTKKGTGGAWSYIGGTSSAGLAKAGIALPAVGELTGLLPASQGIRLPGVEDAIGGINTGYPDSMCMSDYKAGSTPSGLSTTALGAGAPAYYEVGEPTNGQAPKGVMLLIHGGGWSTSGPGHAAALRGDAERWRARGWRTLNISYRPCELAIGDVLWFYERARALWGAELPYCALGASAGGNLALLLAAKRSSLACVLNQAGPTNGESLPNQYAWGADGLQKRGPGWVYNHLMAAIGTHNVYWASPVNFPIKARVLSAISSRDAFIPRAQVYELRDQMLARDARAYADVAVLASGTSSFVHAGVSQAALNDYYVREARLVAPLVGG